MKNPTCSSCGKPAAVQLAYAARHLCRGCFIRYFEKRFLKTVREFSIIKPGERIAAGVSGGKDSIVLLHLLSSLRKKLPFEIVAITIDEGIKGYRPKTLKVAKRECKKLGIPLVILEFKKETGFSLDEMIASASRRNFSPKVGEMMRKSGTAACSWCGVFRRYLLNRGARAAKADKIAIGHNLDDVAQTVLMNLMRNEPLRLARFLAPTAEDEEFVQRIRPLLRTPEKEVAIYATLRGIEIEYAECPYAYQSFRQHVKTQLNDTEGKYPGTKLRILNSFLELDKLMQKGLEGQTFKIQHCERCSEPSGAKLCMACKMLEKLRD